MTELVAFIAPSPDHAATPALAGITAFRDRLGLDWDIAHVAPQDSSLISEASWLVARVPYDFTTLAVDVPMARRVAMIPLLHPDPRWDELTIACSFEEEVFGALAARHAQERGYERAVTIASGVTAHYRRQQGFLVMGRQLGLRVQCYEHPPDLEPQAGEARLFAWLDSQEKPLLVFRPGDQAAAWLRDQAIARGVRVPEDMAIIGAGDHIVCTYREPTLTSVAFPWRKMGEAAALALLHKQRGNVHPPVARLRPVTVVARTSTRTPAIQDRLVRDALSWMRRHLPSSRPADEAAAALGTTPSTLTRRFRKALSRTPKQEHTRLRIEKAEKMLLSSERSLEAIARACGFNGAVPFSVAFKRSRGTSPGQWRKAQ